jgi:hypothetical protein
MATIATTTVSGRRIDPSTKCMSSPNGRQRGGYGNSWYAIVGLANFGSDGGCQCSIEHFINL